MSNDREEKVLTSHDLYPTMMRGTKLLVLDYDVTRYHSFDLFRYLLMDRDRFMDCDKLFYPMLNERDILKQLRFYLHHARSMNPYDNFTSTKNKMKIADLEPAINNIFLTSITDDIKLKITPTDLNYRLSILFDNNSVTGYLLHYKNDNFIPQFHDKVTVYESDTILNLRMAVSIIMQNQINAVMLSSIDLAIILAEYLLIKQYKQEISFIVGAYYYNYDSKTGIMRLMNRMNALEYKCKHEFGIFDPFTGLSQAIKEGESLNEH